MKEIILYIVLPLALLVVAVALVCFGFYRIRKPFNKLFDVISIFLGIAILMAAFSIPYNYHLQVSVQKTKSDIIGYAEDGYIVYMDGQEVMADALNSINYANVTIEINVEDKQINIISK